MVTINQAVHKDTAKQYGGQANPGSVTGLGGLAYEGPWQLDKKYYTTGNTASQQYQKAATQILQGAEGADAAMLRAYRDMYRARLGGAAAGQAQQARSLGAESVGQGLSPDIVRRILAGGQANQAQQLAGVQGDLMGQYGMNRASLIQKTGNSLANLLIDETKFGKSYAAGRAGAGKAALAAGIGAVGTIAGAAIGGPLGGFAGGQLAGGLNKSGAFGGGNTPPPGGYGANAFGGTDYLNQQNTAAGIPW